MEYEVQPNAQSIAGRATSLFLRTANKAIKHHGSFYVALSGGSTPKKLYDSLADMEQRHAVDWSKIHFFLGDERMVPHDSSDSNQKLVEDHLLNRIPDVDRTKVHVVHTHLSPSEAAADYEATIRRIVPADSTGRPRFDLILLGMGSDGHTASLFPNNPATEEVTSLVVDSKAGVLPPDVHRVTFTYSLINTAANVVFMVSGADKLPALRRVRSELNDLPQRAVTPAGKVRPVDGKLYWLVDQAADTGIPE